MAEKGPDAISVVADIGGQEITFETGRLAKQANGSVLVRSGDTNASEERSDSRSPTDSRVTARLPRAANGILVRFDVAPHLILVP